MTALKTKPKFNDYDVEVTPGREVILPKIKPGNPLQPGSCVIGPTVDIRTERPVYWKIGTTDTGTGLVVSKDGRIIPLLSDAVWAPGVGLSVIRREDAGQNAAKVDHSQRHHFHQSNWDLPVHMFIGWPEDHIKHPDDYDGYVAYCRRLLEPETIFAVEKHFERRNLRIREDMWTPERVLVGIRQEIEALQGQGGNQRLKISERTKRLMTATEDLNAIRERIVAARKAIEQPRPDVSNDSTEAPRRKGGRPRKAT